MDQAIHDRYSPAVLDEARRRYGIAPDQIRPVKAFESLIFEFERAGAEYILRLSHSLRRSPALIAAEAEWINFLADDGISVARALPSAGGQLVEAVEDGQAGQFLATAFYRAQGEKPWDMGWPPDLCHRYGRLLGRIHTRTQRYRPSRPEWTRPAWDAPLWDFVGSYLPDTEVIARRRYHDLVTQLRRLPTTPDVYGLIHQDAHGGNLLVDSDGALTLFDFDDCGYSWFANEIAIVLFYTLTGEPDPLDVLRRFLPPFLDGYRSASPLDDAWLAEIPAFLKLRELELYAVMHRDFDVTAIDDPWCADFMRGRKARIENDTPFVDFSRR